MPIIESRCSRSACAATFALALLACSLMPDFSSVPEAERPRASMGRGGLECRGHHWHGAGHHRRRHVRGLGRQLADRADGSDVWGTATARAGVIDMTGPDFADIMRTLTVTIDGDRGWHLSVTAGRGAVPASMPLAGVNRVGVVPGGARSWSHLTGAFGVAEASLDAGEMPAALMALTTK
jgi:hypothetical protein